MEDINKLIAERESLVRVWMERYWFSHAICNHEWRVTKDEYGSYKHCPKCMTWT